MLISGALTIGGIWVWKQGASRWGMGGFAENRPVGGSAISHADFARVLKAGLLSGEECASSLETLSPTEIHKLLSEEEPGFWASNANAGILLRQAAHVLAVHAGPEQVMADIGGILALHKLDAAIGGRLLAAALSGVLEQREVDRAALIGILQQAGAAHAPPLLETWFGAQHSGTISGDVALAMDLAGKAFSPVSDKLREDSTAAVIRSWAHRAPPIADVLYYADHVRGSDEFQMRLAREGVRWALVSEPDELQKRLIELSGQIPKDQAGSELARAGMSPARMIETAAKLPAKDQDEVLNAYMKSLCDDDPRVMSKIARTPAAKTLPPKAKSSVARGLMKAADFDGVKNLLDGTSDEEKAKLLDGIYFEAKFSQLETPDSESSARFYLEHRPSNVASNPEALKRVLPMIPSEEAEAFARSQSDLSDDERIQIRRMAAWNRVFACQEDPEKIFEMMQITADDVRNSQMSFLRNIAPETLQRWAGKTSDAKLQDELLNQGLYDDVSHQNTVESEKSALALVSGSANPETYKETVSSLVKVSAAQDSGEATNFVSQLPAGPVRDAAMGTLVDTWAKADPVAASDWLSQQPAGPGRDAAVANLVSAIRSDPQTALADAAAIENPALRMEAAKKVLRVWRDADPSAVADLLLEAGFPEGELPKLRALLRAPSQPSASP
ncbi:MAG TPA: hypothetical protein VGH90_01405 [Chthoniobacteraceae bacterium]